jgi:hypothetical protein
MAAAIYSLCAITALACTLLLAHSYRKNRYSLLLWSSLCFAGLTVNNLLLVIDKVLLPAIDLAVFRNSVALLSLTILLYGLIWRTE